MCDTTMTYCVNSNGQPTKVTTIVHCGREPCLGDGSLWVDTQDAAARLMDWSARRPRPSRREQGSGDVEGSPDAA